MMTDNRKQVIPEDRTLQDRAYDLFGELLLERETAALLAEIDAEQARGETAKMDAFFVNQDVKNLERIRRHFARHRARVFFRETLPRIGQISAIVIASVAVAGSVAIATSHTVRVQVMQLLVNIEEEYTELKLREDTAASFDIPAEWGGENYPSFIPDGFVLGAVHSNPGYSTVIYTDLIGEGRKLYFSELGESAETNLDTEASIIEPIQINQHQGTMAIKEGKISAYWDDGRHYFILITEGLDESVFLRVAEGVIRVR